MAQTNTGATVATNLNISRYTGTAETIAQLSFGALHEISALCTILLSAFESPGTLHLESTALCLQVIREKADDIANCIDYEAEQINLSISCPRATARRTARSVAGV